jgi:cytochrome bd ubiquinol oxidase subunit I
MTFSGWIATLAGWYVTEIGRQPWLVQGLLTAKQAAATVVTPLLLGTLLMYMAVYIVLLVSYTTVLFYLARKAGEPEADKSVPNASVGASAPLTWSAA